MPAARSMAELEQMLRKELQVAMNEVQVQSLADMLTETHNFYSSGHPKIYQRTGQLGNSPRVTGITGGGNTLSFRAYLQLGSYHVPNPAFTSRGYASYFSPLQVMNAAEYHFAHVLGRPGFWNRSQLKMERNLNRAMSSHFK